MVKTQQIETQDSVDVMFRGSPTGPGCGFFTSYAAAKCAWATSWRAFALRSRESHGHLAYLRKAHLVVAAQVGTLVPLRLGSRHNAVPP